MEMLLYSTPAKMRSPRSMSANTPPPRTPAPSAASSEFIADPPMEMLLYSSPSRISAVASESSSGAAVPPTTIPVKIRIGCVPEHFSSPLYIAHELGLFIDKGLDVSIITCPGGTGEMTKLLKEGQLDMAISLTEGLVSYISNNNSTTTPSPFKIVGTFTSKPLTWSVAGDSKIYSPTNTTPESIPVAQCLKNSVIGVSRIGSGSYIIPFVEAYNQGWNVKDHKNMPFTFVVLNDIRGLARGVQNGDADVFLWEKFTTKPLYDSGELFHLSNITPPWPAFMFAASTNLTTTHPEAIKKFLTILQNSAKKFISQEESMGSSIEYVVNRFKQTKIDVEAWFETVGYYEEMNCVDGGIIGKCLAILKNAGVVGDDVVVGIQDLVDTKIAQII